MHVSDQFGILDRGPEGRSLGQLAREYVSEETLENAYSAYTGAFKTNDQALIKEAYAKYKKAYDDYVEETPLREELEKLAKEQEEDVRDTGNLDKNRPDYAAEMDRANLEQKARLQRMEKLWPGWYQAHLDWKIYFSRGGQPVDPLNLKENVANAANVGIQLIPFLPYTRGMQIRPWIQTPRSTFPFAKPALTTPRGLTPIIPVTRLPVATPGAPPKSVPVQLGPFGEWAKPIETPSTSQKPPYASIWPRPWMEESPRIYPPQEMRPFATPKPPLEYPQRTRTPVPTPGNIPTVPIKPPAAVRPPIATQGGLPAHLKPLPVPTWFNKYPKEVRDAYIHNERLMIETGIVSYEDAYKSLVKSETDAFTRSLTQDVLNSLAKDLGFKIGPAPALPLMPGEKLPPTKGGFAPIGGAPESPGPGMLYPLPTPSRIHGVPWSQGPYGSFETSPPPYPSPFQTAPGTGPFEPHFKWGETPQSKAPSEPAPVATQGAGSNQCPQGQFWDGVQCRGSIGPMPGGIPGGLTAAPGPVAQAASFPSLTIGRRFPVVNL